MDTPQGIDFVDPADHLRPLAPQAAAGRDGVGLGACPVGGFCAGGLFPAASAAGPGNVCHSMSARRMYGNRRPKLCTLARDELQGVEKTLQMAQRAIDRLSPETKVEIGASFRRNRFVGPARAGQPFRQMWQRADDHFLLVQASCERMEAREGHLSPQMRCEFEAIVDVLDRLRAQVEDLTVITRKILEQALNRPGSSGASPVRRASAMQDPLVEARSWLQGIRAALEHTRIHVDRGGDAVPERALVAALAELYRVKTDKEPARTYRPWESRA